ncbi:hypothetical protein BX265_8529 [Streptomyces sp. TLI_235]|nr:hypothetical protein BX265_8529 [Streptomyces sp. TLI_235]
MRRGSGDRQRLLELTHTPDPGGIAPIVTAMRRGGDRIQADTGALPFPWSPRPPWRPAAAVTRHRPRHRAGAAQGGRSAGRAQRRAGTAQGGHSAGRARPWNGSAAPGAKPSRAGGGKAESSSLDGIQKRAPAAVRTVAGGDDAGRGRRGIRSPCSGTEAGTGGCPHRGRRGRRRTGTAGYPVPLQRHRSGHRRRGRDAGTRGPTTGGHSGVRCTAKRAPGGPGRRRHRGQQQTTGEAAGRGPAAGRERRAEPPPGRAATDEHRARPGKDGNR